MEWICQWKSNKWEVVCTKVWRTEDWKHLLEIGRSWPLKVGWVKGHEQDKAPAAKWNQQVDHLSQIRVMTCEKEDWDHSAERLHIKQGHSGKADLYYECQSWGWPVPMKNCDVILTACPQCWIRLKATHPYQAPTQCIKQGKALQSTWQTNYIGALKPCNGKKYILLGVEIVSGLSMARAVRAATRDQTVKALQEWCSFAHAWMYPKW